MYQRSIRYRVLTIILIAATIILTNYAQPTADTLFADFNTSAYKLLRSLSAAEKKDLQICLQARIQQQKWGVGCIIDPAKTESLNTLIIKSLKKLTDPAIKETNFPETVFNTEQIKFLQLLVKRLHKAIHAPSM
jgi:hypothetical protein